MKIEQNAMVGTMESSDCLVMVKPYQTLEVNLDSIVEKRFGHHIRSLILEILSELQVESGYFHITDRGALDYCLKARITSAVRRGTQKC